MRCVGRSRTAIVPYESASPNNQKWGAIAVDDPQAVATKAVSATSGKTAKVAQKVLLKMIPPVPKLHGMITTLQETPVNERKISQLQVTLQQALLEALQRGFYGTVGLELSVHDGTIQQIRRRVERVEK
jgi:hypothetical protein